MPKRNDSTSQAEDSEFNSTVYSSELMTFSDDVRSVPLVAQCVIILMYSTVIVVSVGGNTLVAYSIIAQQRMKTVTNYFILNLACADMLTAVICVPFTFVANLLMLYWPFGSWMCPIVTYAQAVAVFLTAFTLVGISLDRFRAVLFPLKQRMSVRQAALVVAAIWLTSLAVPLPVAILSKVVGVVDGQGVSREHCEEVWSDQRQRYVYTMVIMILQYFLPLSVLTFTYASIGFVIWIKKTPGEAENARDKRLAASKRKMVKMMITVVVIYALCWLPLHCITLVGDAHPSVWLFPHIQTVWIACHWLAMSNCCYNPIVYFWMNAKFRQGFRNALRWCPCVRGGQHPAPPHGTMTIYSTVNQRQKTLTVSPGKTPPPPQQQLEAGSTDSKRRNIRGNPVATGCTAVPSSSSSSSSPYSTRFRQRSGVSAILTSFETNRPSGRHAPVYEKQMSLTSEFERST